MVKFMHEIRDPIHVFIRLDTDERKVVDSRPFQRLRHIHQLALTYLVYPSATHKRFEHSLGTMELASRVFDVVTHPDAIHPNIRSLFPEVSQLHMREYWKRVLRMAALCHDIGHLPFSHAAEKELLPDGWNHERITVEIIRSEEMSTIWHSMTPPLRTEDVAKIAVGPKILSDQSFTDWETILSEIVSGDAFGVDRIDYLLRDSHHAGVGYGKFDHYRLIDTLRILPASGSNEPALGVEEGGIHAAEALLLARYFMYTQVYFHRIRRIYDKHLIDFLKEWIPGGKFPIDADELIKYTDIEVTNGMLEAARDSSKPGHDAAMRIMQRKHFKEVYSRNPEDLSKYPEPGKAIFAGLSDKYGLDKVRHDSYIETRGVFDFPIQERDGRVVSSIVYSDTLRRIPTVMVDSVFIDPDHAKEAEVWLSANRDCLLENAPQEE